MLYNFEVITAYAQRIRLWEGGALFYVRPQPLLKLQINADCFILLPGFVRPLDLMPRLANS